MIINLQEILEIAEKNNYAVAAFNTPTFENLIAAIRIAERYDIPLIIQHAQVHDNIMPLEIIGPCMIQLANNSKAKICVHLDHGEDVNYITRALEYGFSSVMYDGSNLEYDQNVNNTKGVVKVANKFSAGVEAEIGIMGGNEGNTNITESVYTDVSLAERFVKDTNINALAASFGTVHGFYYKEPELDYQRIADIKETTGIPVVMHGGSGLSDYEYRESIKNGVRKINYYSYSARAGVEATKELLNRGNITQYHEITTNATDAIEDNYYNFVKVLYDL